MRKLGIIAVLVSMLAGVAETPAAQGRSRPNRYLRFGTYDGRPSGPDVIPEYAFATRVIGWVSLRNGSSVGDPYPVSARGVSWRDFLRLEIRHDGQRAESWVELSFDVDTTTESGLAFSSLPSGIRRWEKAEKLHPSSELRPDSSVSIPFEVHLRDGCPLRLGSYEVVASFDPAIARVPELAWIAELPPQPEPAVWRVGLTPAEAAIPWHKFTLFQRDLNKQRMRRIDRWSHYVRFWLAEAEKDPASPFLVAQAINWMTDWDEIERLLLEKIAWVGGGGTFRKMYSLYRTQAESIELTLNRLQSYRAEGKTGEEWMFILGDELEVYSVHRRDKAQDDIMVGGPQPPSFPASCQLPMPE
ncbi:MAG: hypothetical protein HYV63_00485 [Candidatus Schekmanbacteria bacterium]|nr:hypothetical protein [Candidatus Schekmanbacteria bacterium]